jgi:hypothetical protein
MQFLSFFLKERFIGFVRAGFSLAVGVVAGAAAFVCEVFGCQW